MVSGHFGNYDVMRANLLRHRLRVGGRYRRMDTLYFQGLYIKTISKIGDGLYERGRSSLKQMLTSLKSAGIFVVLIDQRFRSRTMLNFMDHPANTWLSIVKFVLKLDAVVVPA